MIDGVTSVFQGAIGKTSLGTSKYHVLASALLDQDSHRISFSGADEDEYGDGVRARRMRCARLEHGQKRAERNERRQRLRRRSHV